MISSIKLQWYATMCCISIGATLSASPHSTMSAHLSSAWYPHTRTQLHDTVQQLAAQAQARYDIHLAGATIRALIVPHAALTYSGIVAAAAYRLVDAAKINRIIILAPSHTVPFHGVAVPHFATYELPTGSVSVLPLPKNIPSPLFHQQQNAFHQEHALEIQLPFVRFFFPQAKIIPLIIGDIASKEIDSVVRQLAQLVTPTTLVVISTDMTHYGTRFSYTPFSDNILLRVRHLDGRILDAIQRQSYADLMQTYQETDATICGITPLAILMRMIEHNLFGDVTTHLIAYATSEEVSKDATGLVSYASLATMNRSVRNELSNYEKSQLLAYAQETLKNSFTGAYPADLLRPIMTPLLTENRGVFVTLYDYKKGKKELRGCIGTTAATRPLYQNVADMTRAAAFSDTRFAPVTHNELTHLTLEISVLEQPRKVTSYRNIVLHKHGIILTVGTSSALFLPQVAGEFGWTLEQTLEQLSKKAGLPADAWKKPEAQFQVFETVNFEKNIT